MHDLEPARALGLADDDVGDVVGLGVAGHLVDDARTGNGDGGAAELLGEAQAIGDAVAFALVEAMIARRLDIERRPGRVEPVGEALGVADEAGAGRVLADADQHALAGGPRAADGMRAHIAAHLLIDALRRASQRQLAQGGEIARLEIMADGALGLLRQVDLAFLEALDQILGREVDDLDVVGAVEDAVGHRLAHADARDLRDHVVEALDVLDVERGVDVDAGGEQLLDVEVALGMAAAGRVGVRKLVDQHQLGTARQDGVEVHLLERAALVVDAPARDELEPGDQRFGLAPSMRLDDTDGDIGALAPLGLRRFQHLEGLADPGRRAQEDLQLAAALARNGLEQRLGRGALVTVGSVGRGHGTS